MALRISSICLFTIATWGCGEPDSQDVTVTRIQDAWVFHHQSNDHDDALHSGAATIDENDCLLIGAAVVIWRKADLPKVADIVDEVIAGTSPMVRVGGGLGQKAKSEVVDKCPVDDVWYAGALLDARER